jgi:LCCL domain
MNQYRAPTPTPIRSLLFTGLSIALSCTLAMNAVAAGTVGDFGKDLDRSTTLHHFQVDKEPYIGQRFEFNCPAKTVRDKDPEIHGTTVYPANTALCVAAQHAGVVGTQGGPITVQLNPGVAEYQGTRRNGVASLDLPGTQLSIMFLSEGSRAELDELQRKWKPRLKWDDKFSQTGLANIRLTGQRFAFDCPSAPDNLAGRAVYGTEVYPLHSLVCLTAVHAGQITKSGGSVLIQMDPALEGSFVGSIRNGIESKNNPKTARSITFHGRDGQQKAAKVDNPAAGAAVRLPRLGAGS